MARVLSIATDLMLSSRVTETLGAAGHEVTTAASIGSASLDDIDVIVADLEVEGPMGLVGHGIPTLGYYSHVDAETKAVAEAAGVDKVVPRSRMARELPQLVAALLG
jgi:hypothetical protein